MGQMNHNGAFKTEPSDDIRIFMPSIRDEEYEQRARIRRLRNIANYAVMQEHIPEGVARNLYLCLLDTATDWLYAPADLERITMVAQQCKRLFIVAQTAQKLEGSLP